VADLIDVHAHFLTDDYVAAARAAGHEHPDNMPGWPSWSVGAHLAMMDELGIATAYLSLSSPAPHFGDDAQAVALSRGANDVAHDAAERHPGRLRNFATLPLPDVDAAVAETRRALERLGAAGVGLYTSYDGHYLDEAMFAPLLRELDRRRTLVFLHPTAPHGTDVVSPDLPVPMVEFLVDTARAVTRMRWHRTFSTYPGIRWIVPHGGGLLPLLEDRVRLVRDLVPQSDALDDFSQVWFDLAGKPMPTQLPALVAMTGGTDRVLYGSDYCWTAAGAVGTLLAQLRADSRDWDHITTTNARLLGLG
jgi:6-methylsalicylate decarboxylase